MAIHLNQFQLKSNFIIIMKVNFKYVLFSLFAHLALAVLVTHNYNYSRVHEQALISEPLYIQTRPIPSAQHKVYMPLLIDSFQLKKYQLKDTNYHPQQQDLSADDQFLLFNMDPPRHLFSQQSIFIESYQLLQLRKFSIKVTNPSKKFRICITDIISDRLEVRREDERGILPMCLQSQEKYNFNFAFYAAWLNPQYVQGAIYFFVQIYDGKILAQEKVYARKILVTIKPNHLRIQTPVFRNCPRHNALMIKNYEIFDICIVIEGKKKFETMEGTTLDGEKCIGPTKSIKILLEGKSTQMLIHTRGPSSQPPFPSLFLYTICEQSITLDYFNIGILPQERTIFEYPLTISSSRGDNVTLEEIYIQSSSQTVTFEEMPTFKGIVPPSAKNLQIGMLKILARKQPQRKSVINIKLKFSTLIQQFYTYQKYIYQQLRNPISAGPRRFIDLRKNQGIAERFSLKNNLNIPIFITKLFYDETIMELSWIGERRKIVPPNHSVQELAFKYVGPKSIRLSPQKYILIVQFNGNILVPIEIVLYDQTLQCLVDNQAKKCVSVSHLDFGYFRDLKSRSKQIVLRNWNPQGLPVTLEVPTVQSKQNNINLSLQIFGPLPSDQLYVNDHNYKDFFLKPNHFMVINIIVQPQQNATSVSLPFIIVTNQQIIRITLVIKIENGTIALIPQVVRFQNPIGRTIQYLNLVSTYEQKYKISSVSTNLSTIIVAVPPHVQLQGNQFVGMTVVYSPQKDENITEGDWSPSKKQADYFLFRLKKQYENVIFAQIKLITTTELQAKSTVIIEKNYKPMVLASQGQQIDRGVRTMKYVLTKRKMKPVRYNEPKQIYQISIEVENNFPLNLKYKPLLVPEVKFLHLDTFFRMYRLSKQEIIEEIFFCVSQKVKAKTRMSVMQVRDIFNLQQVPDQYIMDVANPKAERPVISMYTFKNQRNQTIEIVPNTKTYFYLLKAFENQCKICYFFLHHEIINRLILSEMLFKILSEEGERTLREFVRNEIQNMQSIPFFQNETTIHVKTKLSYQQYCYDIPEYAVYRFCDNLNGKVHNITALQNRKVKENNDLTYSMVPTEKHRVNLQLLNPVDSFKFYFVVANNHTKFQTYEIQVEIKQPHLYVRNGFISPQFSEIYEQSWGKSKGINLLPIQLFLEDYHIQDKVFEGTRIFEIVNDGQTDLLISHIGIDEKQKTCSQKGIIVYGLSCGQQESSLSMQPSKTSKQTSFTIKSMSKYNLTIKFLLNLKFWPSGKKQLSLLSKQSLRYMVYLYDQKGYYFKLQLIFRIGDTSLATAIDQYINPHNMHTLYRYFTINIVSLLIIYLLLRKMKEEESNFQITIKEERQKSEEDPFRRMLRYKRLTRVMKENRYEDSDMIVGVRLNKKAVERPIHKVTQDLVLSAKEVTQRDLKKYFNESQESAIGVILEMNHHLSLSESISDHGIHGEPQIQEIISQPSQKSSLRSSHLPEGQEVDLTDEIDQDSWYDFNRETANESHSKSNRNINTSDLPEAADQQEFYNVFRSDISLKKFSWNQKQGKTPKKNKLD